MNADPCKTCGGTGVVACAGGCERSIDHAHVCLTCNGHGRPIAEAVHREALLRAWDAVRTR